jgi:cytochrome c oxidase subunit IV
MGRQAWVALYLLAMIVVIVGVDLLFFRHHAWERLAVNMGIVLVFVAFFYRFLKER